MALRVQTLSGNQLFNFANGMMRITVMAEKIDQTNPANDRPLMIHSAEVAIPDSGVDLPLGTIKGINREINDVFNSRQDFATSTIGKQVLTEKNVDVTFAVDANQMLMDSTGASTIANNILFQMFASGGYKLQDTLGVFDNKHMYKIAGTNGTTKRSSQCKTDLDFKGLFWRDGMLAEPQAANELGELLLTENTRVTAYNNFNLCVMLEFIYKFSDAKVTGYRFPYATCGEPSMTEGEDFNKFKFTASLLSDTREINKSFIEGISQYEEQMYSKETQYFVGGLDDSLLDDVAMAATGADDVTTSFQSLRGNIETAGLGTAGTIATGAKPLGVGVAMEDIGSLYKKGEIIFGTGVKYNTYSALDGSLVENDYLNYVTERGTFAASGLSTLRNGQYIKIYVRGEYEEGIDVTNDLLDNVKDSTSAYLLGKVVIANGQRRIYAVYPKVDRKGAQAKTPTVISTSVAKEFLMPVFDWDYDLRTMTRFTLNN